MRLENVGRFGDRAAGDLAANEDLAGFRQRLAPLLPALYTFLARRSQDQEEAEDLLVETLCLAKATVVQRGAGSETSLPWLLRLADRNLRSRIERNPLLDAGLAPNWVVPTARLPEGLLDGVARLGWDDRQALGLRYGDGLTEDVVAQTLGADPGTGAALVERALDAAHDGWAQTLQEYSRSAGAPPTQVIHEALPALHAAVSPSRAQEELVWRRVEEERHELFVPGRPLPLMTGRFRRAFVLLASFLVLTVAALLWFGRGAASPAQDGRQGAERERLAAASTARTQGDATGVDASASPNPARDFQIPAVDDGTPSRRSWDQFARDRQQYQHDGTLYYLLAIPYGSQLATTALDNSSPSGALIAESYADVTYAISPTDGRVVVGDRKRLWVQEGVSARELIRGHFSGYRGPTRPAWGITGQLAWHPKGRMVAVTIYDGEATVLAPTVIQTVMTDTLERVAVVTLLPGEFVTALSYSPDGRNLLISSDSRALVIDTARGNTVARLPASVDRAYWSSSSDNVRLLWIGKRKADANSAFGTVRRDGTGLTVLGKAAHTGWHPDGERILTARFGRGAGFEFWSHDAPTGKREKLAEIAEMDTSVGELAFGPDGRHLAYGNKEGLFLVHLGSGRVQKLLSSVGGVYSVRWDTASPGQPSSVAR
ncbi:MAG: hypothetical protein H0V86_08105 [Chloroflexia bacterium]|nr:hypothetical protein [Chloroflexia bacterium]